LTFLCTEQTWTQLHQFAFPDFLIPALFPKTFLKFFAFSVIIETAGGNIRLALRMGRRLSSLGPPSSCFHKIIRSLRRRTHSPGAVSLVTYSCAYFHAINRDTAAITMDAVETKQVNSPSK